MDSILTNTQKYLPIDGSLYEVIDSLISQEIFSYLKIHNMQCKKKNTASYISTSMLYATRLA